MRKAQGVWSVFVAVLLTMLLIVPVTVEAEDIKVQYRYRDKEFKTTEEVLGEPWIFIESGQYTEHYDYERIHMKYSAYDSWLQSTGSSFCVHNYRSATRYVKYDAKLNVVGVVYIIPGESVPTGYTKDSTPYVRVTYCTRKVTYDYNEYYRWGEWTAWSETAVTATPTREVETRNAYSVTYDANGGVSAPDPQWQCVDAELTLSEEEPVREGYCFTGWSLSSDGDVMYQSGALYTEKSSVTLYAVWEKICDTHSFGSWVIQEKPSCTEDGQIVRSCTECPITESVAMPATGHSYTSTVVSPTCDKNGCTVYTCSNCGDTYEGEVVEATGHSWETVVQSVTCTRPGFTKHICTICGGEETVEEMPALGHSFGGWSVAKMPDCETEGSMCRQCSACQEMETTPIAASGHTFSEGVCTTCGKVEKQPVIAMKYPTLTFEDVIVLNVYYTAENLQNVMQMGLITFPEQVEDYRVETAQTVIPGYSWSQADGMYVAKTAGIAPKDMGDTIYFAVYARLTDGSYTYSKLVSYSPSTYAYAQLSSGNEVMKSLVVAMLNYGAAAQKYFGYKTDCLVNAALTSDQIGAVEGYRSDMIEAVASPSASKQGELVLNGGFAKRYPTVTFEGAFCINYYCTPSEMPVNGITMYYWNQADYEANPVLHTDNATGAVEMAGSGTSEYQAAVEGIAAKDLDKGVYVCFVYDSETTTYYSGVLAYSIGTYCGVQATVDGITADLAQATAVYGYYAKQFFGV